VVTMAASEVATTLPGIFPAILILIRNHSRQRTTSRPENGRLLQVLLTWVVL
jgi:hypothetical protein